MKNSHSSFQWDRKYWNKDRVEQLKEDDMGFIADVEKLSPFIKKYLK